MASSSIWLLQLLEGFRFRWKRSSLLKLRWFWSMYESHWLALSNKPSVVFSLLYHHAMPGLIHRLQYYCKELLSTYFYKYWKQSLFPARRRPSLFCGHVSKVLTSIDSFSQTDSLVDLEIWQDQPLHNILQKRLSTGSPQGGREKVPEEPKRSHVHLLRPLLQAHRQVPGFRLTKKVVSRWRQTCVSWMV